MSIDIESRLYIVSLIAITSIIVAVLSIHKASVLGNYAEIGKQAERAYKACHNISNCYYTIKKKDAGLSVGVGYKDLSKGYGVYR